MIKFALIFIVVMTYSLPGYAQSILQSLNNLNNFSISGMQSSYDKTGKNMDYFQYANFGGQPGNTNFIEVVKKGRVNNPGGTTNGKNEYVICKLKGPAVLERIWLISLFTGKYDAKIKFYFDGEKTPRITTTDRELFSGNYGIFSPPLVHGFQSSSGGSVSYLPMNIKESLIITVDSARIYYQFGYRKLSPDTILVSWPENLDTAYLFENFRASGSYPKDNFSSIKKDTGIISLNPNQSQTVFISNNMGAIEGIQIQIPALDIKNAYSVADEGRYHKGVSKFTMKIDPNAEEYILTKRMSKMNLYGTYNTENAKVLVDGDSAGLWANTNFRDYHFWENVSYTLPKSLCVGKTSVTITLQYNANDDWNEFFYWMRCDGILTDSVDVGKTVSETAHNYSSTQTSVNTFSQNFHNTRYKTDEQTLIQNRRVLDSLFIKIVFDDSITAVNCPVGLFFGTGTNDAVVMKSLPTGMVDGVYYNYFTMPYQKNVRVELDNKSTLPLNDIRLVFFSDPTAIFSDSTGYFYTQYRREFIPVADSSRDYIVANVSGKGMLIGQVVEGRNRVETSLTNWLEGDERIYIDDMKSTIMHGTGTEDLYGGAFYFTLDEMSLPQHGMTNSDTFAHRSMYRYNLTDPIYFSKNLTFKLEHGDINNKQADYRSLALFYLRPNDTSYVLTDSIDIGNLESELIHQYASGENSTYFSHPSSYPGEKFRDTIRQDGRVFDTYSQFTITIWPDNEGVRLLRTFFYAFPNQEARVYVDSQLVGSWYNAGNNSVLSWKDDFFYIPAKYTAGKEKLNIQIENAKPTVLWTEMDYKVYTYVRSASVPNSVKNEHNPVFSIYPNPANKLLYYKPDTKLQPIEYLEIRDVNGKVMLVHDAKKETVMDISFLPSAVYIICLKSRDKIVGSQRIVIQH